MKVVMGALNGVRLIDLMNGATGHCSRVTAAVAYATGNNPFFDHCLKEGIFLDFYGLLDEDGAVAVAVLQKLLEAGPLAVNCRLIKGHFHSKIIWWHGYGAYVGSANLTSSAWFSNVECGIFYEEAEIIGSAIQLEFEHQFDYIKAHSGPLTTELVLALKKMRPFDEAVHREKSKLRSQFDLVTKDIPSHQGLASYGPSLKTTAFTRFTSEWIETLELLRGMCREFGKLNLRPSWVPENANPTVHFDQFLHAFYYVRVPDEREDGDETAKSVELVNKSFLKNQSDPGQALRDAAKWWSTLPAAPYGEDIFIRDTSLRMQELFARERLAAWTLDDFKTAFFDVHAFKAHARQVKNSFYGLPADHKESIRQRVDRLAEWLWTQKREGGKKTVLELLQFLIWGTTPSNIAERLWLVTTTEEWRFDHLGPSSLGEAVGWARPDDYPPRNNRTNKALRALGHDIRLFSSN